MQDIYETPIIAIEGKDGFVTPGRLDHLKTQNTREKRLAEKLDEYCKCTLGYTLLEDVNAPLWKETYTLPATPAELCSKTHCRQVPGDKAETCYLVHLTYDGKAHNWAEVATATDHFRAGDVYFCTCGKKDPEYGCVEGGI